MRFAADENFNGKVLDGLRICIPDLDVLRVQDTDLYSAPDPDVLAWAAAEERIVLTHDVQTLVNDAYARVREGLAMPGGIVVATPVLIGPSLDDLEILIGAGSADDFVNQVRYVPIR